MLRRIFALILLSIFISYAALPTFISLVDKEVDITFLIDLNEEESKEKENSKDLEIEVMEIKKPDLNFNLKKTSVLAGLYFSKYSRPHLNIVSPPPEYSNIL